MEPITTHSPPLGFAFQIPPHPKEHTETKEEIEALRREAKRLLKMRRAKLVAHYYTSSDLQTLADETGGCVSDSLEMARFGSQCDAETLVVCGVRFMGETAKILNPEKTVLMPDLEANCSLDLGCPHDLFEEFCRNHPDRTVVVYANTSARVKAVADWMVTSGSAVRVTRHLAEHGEKILWAPDKYLGQYVQQQSGANMLLWDGACIVHEEFNAQELQKLMKQHPDAMVLAHPESPAPVLKLAHEISSTSGIIAIAQRSDADKFIIATDEGLFHKLRETLPDKEFIIAPTAGHGATCTSCARCPWMAMNSLRKLTQALRNDADSERYQIHVPTQVRERALVPINRLLKFTAGNRTHLAGDA